MGRASLFTGMGQYTANLLRGLPAVDDVDVVAFGGPAEPRPPWLASAVEWVPVGEARLGRLAAIDSSMRGMPRQARAERVDVFHAPSVHVRPSFPPVPRTTCPLVVTMHDAIPLSYYRNALPTRTRAFYRWNLRRTRRAARLLGDESERTVERGRTSASRRGPAPARCDGEEGSDNWAVLRHVRGAGPRSHW